MVNTWNVDVSPDTDDGEPRVCLEADRLVHGDRNADYGHPLDDYTRTTQIVNALVAHKLREPLDHQDMLRIMCAVKLSRDVHQPKRDNRVDLAGYAECLERARVEERRRQGANDCTSTDDKDRKVPESTYQTRAELMGAPGGA